MTQENIRQLEKELWDAADELRGNSKLTAAEYKDPILGLVFLRFAQNRYERAKIEIEENLPINPRTQQKRIATKNDYEAAGVILLPDKAKYDYLAELPEDEDIADALNTAMRLIESEYADLQGILPKNYQEFNSDLLRSLVRVFNSDAVRQAEGDVFGRIYEFFLMKFSMSGAGAQEGGEFFTPPSLVNLIVQFIQPNRGLIHDPACGSGGMFVQTAHFVKDQSNQSVNAAISVRGTELKSNNTRLAKMNLAIHGIDGKIIESNSFYSDPHELLGKCDFVMANPPFNVDKIDISKEFVKKDPRLPFGIPMTGKGTCPNGNYLWAQYFYSYLNDTGRAGFVMASSATDAGHSEKRIREQVVETGHVDCIVSIANNFFYTRSLPCHVWFYDKNKNAQNTDKVLMLDARNTYRVVNSTINDFSPGQLTNLRTIISLYRQEDNAMSNALAQHQANTQAILSKLYGLYQETHQEIQNILKEKNWSTIKLDTLVEFPTIAIENADGVNQQLANPFLQLSKALEQIRQELADTEATAKAQKLKKTEITKLLAPYKSKINTLSKPLKNYTKNTTEELKASQQAITDWQQLLDYFPEGQYRDIEGLCKITDLEEIREQDYSLTPGRYVGVALDIDLDFDYQGRMSEIHQELAQLHQEANLLMNQIQAVEL